MGEEGGGCSVWVAGGGRCVWKRRIMGGSAVPRLCEPFMRNLHIFHAKNMHSCRPTIIKTVYRFTCV